MAIRLSDIPETPSKISKPKPIRLSDIPEEPVMKKPAKFRMEDVGRFAEDWLHGIVPETEKLEKPLKIIEEKTEKPFKQKVGEIGYDIYNIDRKVDELKGRFGKKIINAFSDVGTGILSFLAPTGGEQPPNVRKYLQKAYEELEKSGFKGSPAEARKLATRRSIDLAAYEKVPRFKVQPAEDVPEKIVDVGAGITAFISQLALTRKVLPAGTPEPVIWEVHNQLTGGIPGQGAAMRATLGQIGRIPTSSLKGKAIKTALESGTFAGSTAALGGDSEDILISAMIPVVFNTWNFAKQRYLLDNYERTAKRNVQKAYTSELARLKAAFNADMKKTRQIPGITPEQAEAINSIKRHEYRKQLRYLEDVTAANMRNVDRAIQNAHRRIMHDDAFAPTREKFNNWIDKAQKWIKSGNPRKIQVGKDILDWMDKAGYLKQEVIPPKGVMPKGRAPIIRTARPPKAPLIKEPTKPQVTPPKVTPPATPPKVPKVPPAIAPTPEEIATGALPGMGEEVKDTTYKEIIKRFPEYEGLEADELLTDKLTQQWPQIRNEFDALNERTQVLGERPEEGRPEQFAWDRASEDIKTRIDELSDLMLKLGFKPQPQRLEDIPELEEPAEKPAEKKWTEAEWLAERKKVLKEYQGKRFKTANDEIIINRIQKQIAENVAKWQPGQGVGWKLPGQVNRGLRIVEVYPETHQAKIKWIVDTGVIADLELGKTHIVDTIDLIRDKKYDAPVTKPTTKQAEETLQQKVARSKYKSDIIGELVVPTPTSGLKNHGPGKVQHVITDSEGNVRITVSGYGGAHWNLKDFKYPEPEEIQKLVSELENQVMKKLSAPVVTTIQHKATEDKLTDGQYVERLRAITELSQDAIDKFKSMLGTQPTPGQERAVFYYERAPGKAKDIYDDLLYVGLIEKVGEDHVRAIYITKPVSKTEQVIEKLVPKKDIGTIDNINVAGLSRALEKELSILKTGEKVEPFTNTHIKNIVANLYGVNTSDLKPEKKYSHKKVQEAVEATIVKFARDIIREGRAKGQSEEVIYGNLRRLYENQPVLVSRTGKTIARQAYSTPVPLAYITSLLAGIDENTTVFEPTAGTGMLTIGADPKNVTVNEIDPTRSDLLAAQGFKKVRAKDATKPTDEKNYDVVIMNPPFGKYKDTIIDKYKLSRIEHIIAAQNLNAMADDGRAVMIISAPKIKGPYSTPYWVFGNFVYGNYNVVGDFEVSGDLYKRQGAAWPVRIIVINGRQKSERTPPRIAKVRANSWEEVYNIMKDIREAQLPEIELPEGWSIKEQQGRWQVLDSNNRPVGEIVQLEDGTFNVRAIEKEKPEEYGMPEEGKSFDNFADAIKALSNIAQTKDVKVKGKKPKKTIRSKIHVVPAAARKKPPGPEITGGRGEEKPAEELGPVRKPAKKPPEPTGERPEVPGRPGKLPGEREPAGGRPGPRAGGVPGEQRPVRPEPSRKPGERLHEEQKPETKKPTPERGPERPRVPEAERRPEVTRAEKRKPVGVVGTAVGKGKLQIPYQPFSKAPAENENIPTYLEPHVKEGLERLENEVGDIDDYVREQLQYESNEQMWEHLSATQIDTIALAFDSLDKGKGFIIGHQTGVGKGRCAAGIVWRAIARREILRGNKPVFFTAKKDLFTDFYRDMIDIGIKRDQIKPLMINADIDIKDQHNNIVFQKHGGRPNATAAIRKALKTGDYNIVFSTYSQINAEGRQQRAQLAELAYQQIVVMDESHTAAGESNTGEFFRDTIIPHSSGVVFMSATYAKNPKTMMLYARTGLLDAFDGDVDKMMDAVTMGGEPYQEVIAAALARANAYIRTELDFTGVNYETTIDAQHKERDAERADKVTKVLRDIVVFDNMFSAEQIEPEKKRLKAIRKRTKSVGTTIGHTNFAAVAHNAIKQMLLALKIDETVAMALRALKEGKRPFIGVENTMGSFLKRYIEDYGLNDGDKVEGFDYRAVLSNLLKNVLKYRETDAYGNDEVIVVSVSELSLDLQEAYHRIEEHIRDMIIDLPGSPIDEIIGKLEAEGYKVGEITGRDKILKKTGTNEYTLESRSVADRDKTSIAYQYNNGDIQVLIGNVAAAEGMSIHASEKFKNQQKRQMIVAQPHADINKFVQMLGRVNRKGQVVKPEYKILMTSLPSEIRPAAVLEKKMRSLNANTSAKTKGVYQQKQIPDILNLYGDYLTAQYILENQDILRKAGLGVDISNYQKSMGTGTYQGPWHNDKIAKKFTGRLALLSTDEQEEFYEWIEPEFNRLIEYLDKTDQNELISIEKDYKAEIVSSQVIFVGEPGNVFQEVATIDKMSIKMAGRPYTTDEMKKEVDDVVKKAGQETPSAYMQAMRKKLDAAWEKYVDQQGKEKVKQSSVDAYSRADRDMRHLALGGGRMDLEGNPLILLEIMDTFDKKKFNVNPAAPSNIHLRVAVPHPAKTVTLSLSQWVGMKSYYGNVERHYNIPAEQREERYIANGNIIAAMGIIVGDSEKRQKTVRPKVINYTMSDGTIRQGLLLPKGYSPSQDLPTSVNMIPEAAAAYLMDGAIDQRHLKVGEARIFKVSSTRCYMEIPKSKARGMKYYNDTGLVSLIGDFETWRNAMRADFDAEHLPDVLVYLRNKGNAIKSDDNDPDTAREYNNAHRDRPESDYPEAEEEYGMPGPRKPRKITLKREAPPVKTKAVSNREIVKYLSRAFGVPIRGVATHRKKFPGWYTKRSRGIRMKNVNSLRVACHEVGHHIDIYFNNEWSKTQSHAWYGMGAELVRLGKACYGKKRPKGGYKAEGYAEFVFGWLTGAIDLKKEAPQVLKFFEKNYLRDNPEISDILHTARDMIENWKEQGAEIRFDASIGQKLKPEKGVAERFSLWWQLGLADISAPIQHALQENIPSRSKMFGSNDPGFLYEMLTQTEGARATAFVMRNTVDIWCNVTGKSLEECIKPVAKRIKEWTRYVVAARALNLEAREINSGFDPEDALYIFKKYDSPQWRKVADDVTEWNHRVLDYLVQAGALEQEAARRMRLLNPIYIPVSYTHLTLPTIYSV